MFVFCSSAARAHKPPLGTTDSTNDQCIYAALLISYPRPDSAAAAMVGVRKDVLFLADF